MVHGAADTVSGEPHGCLTVGDAPGLTALRDAAVRQLAERFDAAVAAGELSGIDTLVLARWIAAVCQGIAVQAAAERAERICTPLRTWHWPAGQTDSRLSGSGRPTWPGRRSCDRRTSR